VKYWRPTTELFTSVEEAFRCLYHSVLNLALIMQASPPTTPGHEIYEAHFANRQSTLASDLALLEYDPNATLSRARQLALRAKQLGPDGFAGSRNYCDLELQFVPEIVELCIWKAEGRETGLTERIQAQLDRLVGFIRSPVSSRLVAWTTCDETFDLLRALSEASEEEDVWQLAAWLFDLYTQATSWYCRVR